MPGSGEAGGVITDTTSCGSIQDCMPVQPRMISQIEAAMLLRAAMQLSPGSRLPGTVINPTVSCAFERIQHQAGSVYVATHRLVETRSLQAVADALGEPLYLPATLDERRLLSAQAVLRARMLDHPHAEYLYAGRRQEKPVDEDTVAAAAKLITDAITCLEQKDAA